MNTVSLDRQKALAQWVSQATGINSVGVKIRLRGNDLHILCEAPICPPRWKTLSDLLRALQQTDLEALKSNDQPAVYQVFVYGRHKEEQRPQWCHRVFLNQLDKHIEEVERALLNHKKNSPVSSGAIIISNESLARKGDPAAIARYLSETLSTLGVAVKVKVKKQRTTEKEAANKQRLWIFCQSHYTPDPSLIAEPVAQKLRNLNLSNYQDAVIASGVVGEKNHDWLLRIDLTPPEVMLKEWARWGDIEAISRLAKIWLNKEISVQASVKESTLHIFCTPRDPSSSQIPDKDFCLEAIIPQLEILAPQGISAATIYGQKTVKCEPTWIDWISLPAADHQALNISVLKLAKSGDESALLFLLERLLNPDLDNRLATGGIRVMLLRKEDLLHVMCDAPICPTRKKIANTVIEFIHKLQVQGVTGARIYGRRAGNKKPFWQFGIDFQPRQSTVPEAPPEFAATSSFVQDLLPSPDSEPILRPDLSIEEVQTFIGTQTQKWGTTFRKFLLSTQLFIEKDSAPQTSTDTQKVLLAGIWGAIGILLSLQLDWALGKAIADYSQAQQSKVSANRYELVEESAIAANPIKGKTNSSNSDAFNHNGFTQAGKKIAEEQKKANSTAILLAARSQIPTFNSRQLDEQLALYKQRLAKSGPPDVLIVGSSRALRGVDPVALSKALASEGYQDLDVFNFGINGATVQIIELLVVHVLKASELPKIIIWADGVRAFNSGRPDQTFETIAASEGYQQVIQASEENSKNSQTSQILGQELDQKNPSDNQNIYQAFNKRLNRSIAALSATYPQREQFKGLLNQQLKKIPAISNFSKHPGNYPEQDTKIPAVDFDGFLALSVRFKPETYYQNHPKVTGSYDRDYNNFRLMGEQDIALQRMLKYTALRKVPVVFINMPLTTDYLDPIRSKYEEDFRQYISNISKVNNNFIFRDLTELWPEKNDYFSDPSHLNRYGAYKVSKKLAVDPMIPWPRK
ncbi:hypothetical protein [Mastigocoleus testarum]|uniref:DUF1574 domain-containing protein n=1 Tax=Mastigocoleus testarum BC008 TaxID=371196 RepID=A0A0V7ZQR0_9CYAN|nr:hypothetical protein [Mastigocoleus testarum]KST66992.1 hypothetical protein BC008_27780 [Mastigocoleus testarum BC008]KST67119.1 hypothetical protein BC008_28400 [Mastigocoleus testarum BC008]